MAEIDEELRTNLQEIHPAAVFSSASSGSAGHQPKVFFVFFWNVSRCSALKKIEEP